MINNQCVLKLRQMHNRHNIRKEEISDGQRDVHMIGAENIWKRESKFQGKNYIKALPETQIRADVVTRYAENFSKNACKKNLNRIIKFRA